MDKSIAPGMLSGTIAIPGSKSHTIRALVIALLADGESRIKAPLISADTRSALEACRMLGAEITEARDEWIIEGTGGRRAHPPHPIDVGNSGTTLYFLAAVAAITDNWIFFTGDEQIQNRPVGDLLKALIDLGADAHTTHNNDKPPFAVRGPLKGGKTTLECPTSQYLSALLLAAPLAVDQTEIHVTLLNEKPYVTMTLDWLARQDIKPIREEMRRFVLMGGQNYRPMDITIPGDFSSAAFFLTAAAITGGTIRLENLSMSDPQGDKAVVYLLEEMGCSVKTEAEAITITGPDPAVGLKPLRMDLNAIPDALPALAVTACYARGTSELINVEQARLKETDRIAVMAEELRKMGASIVEKPDGLVINGGIPLTGTTVESHGDHRVAMSLSVAALGARGETLIKEGDACRVTFPSFFELFESLFTSY